MGRSQPVTTDSSGPKTGPKTLVWKRNLESLLAGLRATRRTARTSTNGRDRRREADATTRRTSVGALARDGGLAAAGGGAGAAGAGVGHHGDGFVDVVGDAEYREVVRGDLAVGEDGAADPVD